VAVSLLSAAGKCALVVPSTGWVLGWQTNPFLLCAGQFFVYICSAWATPLAHVCKVVIVVVVVSEDQKGVNEGVIHEKNLIFFAVYFW